MRETYLSYNIKEIGIIGFGFVGQAVYSCIHENINPNVAIYDKYKNIGSIDDVLSCKYIFCCVSTPSIKGEQPANELKEILNTLQEKNYNGIIIIKSTVLYHHLDFPNLNIVFNPEFLNQNSFCEDFYNQSHIILGGRLDHSKSVESIYRSSFKLNENVKFEFCSIKEAVEIKYIHNIYHAYKALFWHYVQETTDNQRKIFDLYRKISKPNEMAKIYADGKAGVGGACFPKDMVAFNSLKNHELTKFMIELNKKYRPDEMKNVL